MYECTTFLAKIWKLTAFYAVEKEDAIWLNKQGTFVSGHFLMMPGDHDCLPKEPAGGGA